MEEKIINVFNLMLNELLNAIITGSKAIFILIFGIWLAYFVASKVKKILLKTLKDEMLAGFLSKVSFVGIMIMAVVVTLGTMGVQTTSIIAALGAAGLAIALALKDSLSNLASGIMLVVFRPFTKDDMIEINKTVGIVEDISLFHTYIRKLDGKVVIIPNTSVATTEVTNYTTRHNKIINKTEDGPQKDVIRRIDWLVGIGYDSDILKAKKVIFEAVVNTPNINDGKEDPTKKIYIGVNELQASSIEMIVTAWVVDNSLFISTRCDMIENVKNALDKNNIEIPYNKLDVNLKQ